MKNPFKKRWAVVERSYRLSDSSEFGTPMTIWTTYTRRGAERELKYWDNALWAPTVNLEFRLTIERVK